MDIVDIEKYVAGLRAGARAELEARSSHKITLDFLHNFIASTNIPVHGVFEIGTWRGLSGLYLASAAQKRGTRFITVDIDPAATLSAKDHFAKTGLDDVAHAYCGDSLRLARTLGDDFNIWFVDGLHSYVQVMAETDIILAHGHENLVIFYDDAFGGLHPEGKDDGGVPRAMAELKVAQVVGAHSLGCFFRGQRPEVEFK